MSKYTGKTFLIIGKGLTHASVEAFIASVGGKVLTYTDDTSGTIADATKLGADELSWSEIDYVIPSPSVIVRHGKVHPVVKEARARGIEVVSDFDIFFSLHPSAKSICVTGTNGKSTTVKLIEHILRCCGCDAIACGNIGLPILSAPPSDVYVIEASSYQLEKLCSSHFDIALFLNLTQDHMEKHLTMQNYAAAKGAIFKHADLVICPPEVLSYYEREGKQADITGVKILSPIELGDDFSFKVDGIRYKIKTNLIGVQNYRNIAAAISATLAFGIHDMGSILGAVESFKPLEHRLELVTSARGINTANTNQIVNFINDSKATNAESTAGALESLTNILWLCGGRKKQGGNLHKLNLDNVMKIYAFGESRAEFAELIKDAKAFATLEEAMEKLMYDIQNQYVDKDVINVLFSPACASFDQYKNFEERGQNFKEIITNIT